MAENIKYGERKKKKKRQRQRQRMRERMFVCVR